MSVNTSQTRRRRPPFNPPRPRGSMARTASTPNPRSSGRKPTTRKPSTGRARSKVTGRRSTITHISSDEDENLIDDEAEEAEEEEEEEEAEEEDDYGLESPTPFGETLRSSSEETVSVPTETPRGFDDPVVESTDPLIPPKLLTRLLYHHFSNDDTKLAKDADQLVGKYMEIFVREALARAVHERREGLGDDTHGGDNYLEVEDLEKAAPQMMLDF